jgi:hypothetical protein
MFGAHPNGNGNGTGKTLGFIQDSTLYAIMGSFSVLTGVWLVTLAVRRKPVPNWYLWVAAGGAMLSGASNIARSRMMMLDADIRRFEQQNPPPPPAHPATDPTVAAIESTKPQAPLFSPGA